MPLKNTALTVTYTAFDTANQVGKASDGANHTLNVVRDTTLIAGIANAIIELPNGEYRVTLTASQMNGDFVSLSGSSSTSDIIIIPTRMSTYIQTGYSLAAAGLDSIAVTAPGGVATTFAQMIVQMWRYLFKKKTATQTTLITYADDGTTPETTQTMSEDGTTQTVGDAS